MRRTILSLVLSAVWEIEFPLSKSPKMSADIGIILLPAELMLMGLKYVVLLSREISFALTTAQPILLVPKSNPNIFFIILAFLIIFATKVQISFEFFGIFTEKL